MNAMIVSVYTLDEDENEVEQGSIIWDGDELSIISNTGSDFMSDLLLAPVFAQDGTELVDVDSDLDPQLWFATLPKHYKGSRMWATEPRLLVDSDLENTEVVE